MSGTLSRFAISNCSFVTLANGNEAAFRFQDGAFGDFDLSFYIRWAWDTDFTPLAAYPVYTDEMGIVVDILNTGHMWDNDIPGQIAGTTWRRVYNGDVDYLLPDGSPVSYGQGINKGFQDWVSIHSTKVCEEATDAQWWHSVLVWAQTMADGVYGSLVTPPAPAPNPPPQDRFPPNKVGDIQAALGLAIAQATRTIATKDPTNGNRPIIGAIPVPQ